MNNGAPRAMVGNYPEQWDRGSPTAFSGPRQKHVPNAIPLANFDGATLATKTVAFRVPIPDSRLRVKIGVLGRNNGGVALNFLFAKSVALWLYAADEVPGGGVEPVVNLPLVSGGVDSTQGTPIKIPTQAGLGGYSREFETAGDYIEGVLTLVGVANGVKGGLILQTRYQPAAGQRFTYEEWDEIRREAQPGSLTPIAIVG